MAKWAMESSIPSQYLLILVALAVERGCAPGRLFHNTGLSLDTLSSPGSRIDELQADQIIVNALEATGDPSLGLTVGQQLNMGAHAVVGQTFLACANLMEVLDTLVRYGPLLTGRQAQIDHYKDFYEGRIGLALSLTSPASSARFSHEAIFSAAQKTLSDLLQTPAVDVKISLPYDKPRDTNAFRKIFGNHVRFNADNATLSIPEALTREPLPTSNPTLRALYDAECARLLADLSDNANCSERTLSALNKLEGQYPGLDQMASMLHMSTRTYRRRLQEESTSFQTLLDSTRCKHARQLLRHPELSVDSVAQRLGFSDVSNFRRAFIQWTGDSPSQWRKNQRAMANLRDY
jgi:AraC-like DNA-binding protein